MISNENVSYCVQGRYPVAGRKQSYWYTVGKIEHSGEADSPETIRKLQARIKKMTKSVKHIGGEFKIVKIRDIRVIEDVELPLENEQPTL